MTEPASDVDRRACYARHVLPEIDVLLRVALSMTAQPSDAEDLVQDTLLRAWRSIGTFDGRYPRAWLLTILRNTEINRHRRRRPQLLDDPDVELDRHARDRQPGASAEDAVLDPVFDDAVESALADLPDGFRAFVILVDVDGLTYAEAARVLDVPEGTVMSRLHRARTRIRARLAEAGITPRRRS
ncbi:MAG: sigma-70 family RNA polymerase sigma factor [Mycobacteriales bacterium]